jgi:hypothetical protein
MARGSGGADSKAEIEANAVSGGAISATAQASQNPVRFIHFAA